MWRSVAECPTHHGRAQLGITEGNVKPGILSMAAGFTIQTSADLGQKARAINWTAAATRDRVVQRVAEGPGNVTIMPSGIAAGGMTQTCRT